MSEYRRAHIPGGAYFFTVKTFERKPVLTHEHYRIALREAITEVRGRLPFDSLAWVLLPDHIHTIWKLPEGDVDYSLRWSLIKQHVTRKCNGKESRGVSQPVTAKTPRRYDLATPFLGTSDT